MRINTAIMGLVLFVGACGDEATPGDEGAGATTATGTGGTESGTGGAGGAGPSSTTASVGGSSGEGGSGGGASNGCRRGGPAPEGQQSLTVDGAERSYFVVPAMVDVPVPLVIGFHGYGGSGQGIAGAFGLAASTGGAATLIYPDGVEQDWYQNAVGWDTRSNDTPDIAFTQALIDRALEEHCIDPSRIYVLGFSWGGWMANQVACALGDEVRGFVSVAGGGPAQTCASDVAAMIVHGEADGAEPIQSGEESVASWQQVNGCAATTTPAEPSPCVAYDGCTSPLLWCQHAGDHLVPDFVQASAWTWLESL